MSEKNNDVFTAISIATLVLALGGIGLSLLFKQSYVNPNYTPPPVQVREKTPPSIIEEEEGAELDKPVGGEASGEVQPIEPIEEPAAPAPPPDF